MSNEKKDNKLEDMESEEEEAVEQQAEKKAEEAPEAPRKEMDKLRSDVDSMSQELKTAVTDLKKSIVDIRSAVSEIENPFNLLRVISSEKDLKKLNSKRLPSGVKSLTLGKPEERAGEEEKPEEPLPEEEKPLEQPPAETEIEEAKPQIQLQPKTRSGYLDWVWSLLDSGLSSNDILRFAQSYEFMGYLPAQSNEYIYSLAIACEKARSKGLAKAQLLLSMYKATVISGIKIGLEDVKELISIAEGKLKSRAERTG